MRFKNPIIDTDALFEEAVDAHLTPGEIVLGQLQSIDENGSPVVSFSIGRLSYNHVAQSTAAISLSQVGRQVALLFTNADIQKPIIVGFIFNPLQQMLEDYNDKRGDADALEIEDAQDQVVFDTPLPVSEKPTAPKTLHVDGQRVVIEGQEEVVLMCGEASITLTKAGKIMIRGKYILNRSSGVNRILGGSVQVN